MAATAVLTAMAGRWEVEGSEAVKVVYQEEA